MRVVGDEPFVGVELKGVCSDGERKVNEFRQVARVCDSKLAIVLLLLLAFLVFLPRTRTTIASTVKRGLDLQWNSEVLGIVKDLSPIGVALLTLVVLVNVIGSGALNTETKFRVLDPVDDHVFGCLVGNHVSKVSLVDTLQRRKVVDGDNDWLFGVKLTKDTNTSNGILGPTFVGVSSLFLFVSSVELVNESSSCRSCLASCIHCRGRTRLLHQCRIGSTKHWGDLHSARQTA